MEWTIDLITEIDTVRLNPHAAKYFGFSEYLAALALMVLAWTIGDYRYKFRISTAFLPLQKITFSMITSIGVLTLLTDLWRAKGWPVIAGQIISPEGWQALMGGLFLLTFLSWAWFAFIRPPKFGYMNAKRFASTLYRTVFTGSPTELTVVAQELIRSVETIVLHATNRDKHSVREASSKTVEKTPRIVKYADDILLMLADNKFCRLIVESSPGLALRIFSEINKAKKYNVKIEIFGRNIVNEALINHNSFIYTEIDGYKSGILGFSKPLSQALFSNYRMVENIGTLLDVDFDDIQKWSPRQWKAYSNAVLIVLKDYVGKYIWEHSFVLNRAIGHLEWAARGIYKINNTNPTYDTPEEQNIAEVTKFIAKTIEILDSRGVPTGLPLRVKDRSSNRTIYDVIANLVYKTIVAASNVTHPHEECIWVQYTLVWNELFNFDQLDSAAGNVIKFKVRRMIYNDIDKMNSFPNFLGAKLIGMILHVLGLDVSKEDYYRDSRPLHLVTLAWVKRHYTWLNSYNPNLAQACLVDGFRFDANDQRIQRVYPKGGLRRQERIENFELDDVTAPEGFQDADN